MRAPDQAGVRADLRLATDEVHERLHEAEPFRLIGESALPIEDYGRLLGSILAFHAAIQPVLAGNSETAALGGGRDRLKRLESDLRHIGIAVETPRLGSLALDSGEAVGCLYVVQGSTLGGRVIYRQLDYLFEGVEGRSFFLGSDDEPLKWRKVRALLEEQPPERREALRRGAAKTFALFERCLSLEFAGTSHGGGSRTPVLAGS